MYDINDRINQLGIPLKVFYENTKNEKHFIKEVLRKYPTLRYEFSYGCINSHLYTVYYGFMIEDKIKKALEEVNYNVTSKDWLDFNYRIDLFVNNEVAIQIKSVGYFNYKYRDLKEIKTYLDTIGSIISQSNIVDISKYIFIFYDSYNGDKLYYISYLELNKLIQQLIDLDLGEARQPPNDRLEYYPWDDFKGVKKCYSFKTIGVVDDLKLSDNMKEVIDNYLK